MFTTVQVFFISPCQGISKHHVGKSIQVDMSFGRATLYVELLFSRRPVASNRKNNFGERYSSL